MALILDTSVLIDLDNQDANTLQNMKQLQVRYRLPIKVTFMSYFEFYDGLQNKAPPKLPRSLVFLELFETLLPTKQTARIISQLKHNHPTMTLADLMIAAQTIENDGFLVTSDKDFEQIKELRLVMFSKTPKSLFGINKGMKPFRRDHRDRL